MGFYTHKDEDRYSVLKKVHYTDFRPLTFDLFSQEDIMENRSRTNFVAGFLLILLGTAFLAFQIFPGWTFVFTWPVIIMLVALGILVIGLLNSRPEALISACTVGGIGGILYFQNAGIVTWGSWSYLWTLIPGFAGIGTLLAGLLKLKRKLIFEGIEGLLTSVAMFAIFGSIFGNMFGAIPFKGMVLPLLLISVGIIQFVRALLPQGKRSRSQQ